MSNSVDNDKPRIAKRAVLQGGIFVHGDGMAIRKMYTPLFHCIVIEDFVEL